MSNVRNYHGFLDSYTTRLGEWKIKKQEHKFTHTVEHARHVIYKFTGHTHPYAQKMAQELISKDIAGLQQLDTEVNLRKTYFNSDYAPVKVISDIDPDLCEGAPVAVVAFKKEGSTIEEGLPVNDLDFDYQSGAYAVYNWEVFYHAPYTIALHLSKNGRYAEAQHWFHYIFDPSDNSDPSVGPKRFWKAKPFKIDEVEHIEEIMFNLATGDNPVARDSVVRAIGAWRDSPFRPHVVARTRPTAYMYATVMTYLDNLIAWGDSLFRQDTRESINEAMQLYVLAANILGPRPQATPKRGSNKKQTYASLRNNLDEFGNAAVRLEAEIGFNLFPPPQPAQAKPEQIILESVGRSLYFCIPRNEKFIGYWDTVADRLFKIHNSLNLQGVFRQLPLFPPPIDPKMLARAVAAGVDVGAIIDGSANALLPVRFQLLLQKALEMAQEVKSLGAQILAALEKKDSETLTILRAKHESNMLDLAESVKYAQWQEAIKAHEGILLNIENSFQRFRHYARLLGTEDINIIKAKYDSFDRDSFEKRVSTLNEPVVGSADPEISIGTSSKNGGHKISNEEVYELGLLESSQILQELATVIGSTGSALNLIPEFDASAKPWGLGAGVTFGGSEIGNFFSALSLVTKGLADRHGHDAIMAGKMGSYARREQDWAFQRKAAAGELTQLYKQLRSAEIREYIAEREHEHHLKQIKQSEEVLEFLTNEENLRSGDQRKITTEEFYLWMKREAQGLHSKCFQFAYDIAKKAEKALKFELADASLTFIQSTYLSGKEGLFAGEKLYFDLKRLEMAYMEGYKREFEITKHVSLREWFPLALITLRNSGQCNIKIPEEMFDLDCPGHIFRRIKSVALTIPCVTGPYVSVNCSLTLNNSSYRIDATNTNSFPAAVNSIVTSSAQGDTGLFETNLRDERCRPFEDAGAISSWAIELLGNPKQFDYESITDVILTIRYTARTGGNIEAAKTAAKNWLQANSARVFSMRHEFGSEWAAFKRFKKTNPGDKASLKFSLEDNHFSYRMKNNTENPKRLHLFSAGETSGDIVFKRNGNGIGTTQIVNGSSSIVKPFQPIGDFELLFDSNTIDDLWIVVDWSNVSN